MKYINKILYLVGVFSIIYILIWLYKNNCQNDEPIRWYVSGGFEKIAENGGYPPTQNGDIRSHF